VKIRAIELTNIRRFAGQVARIEGIGDGITVLSEPNEFGKSTFFDALHALFFERHRGTRAPVKALQPHAGGAPEVALEVDLPQGRFRIEKRWLSRAKACVTKDGRVIAQDDEAEAWIDSILGGGLAGPSGLLWVRQGVLGMEPEGTSTGERNERERALAARRDLLSSVAGEIDMVTGGRRLDGVVARVAEALGKLATVTLRPKSGGEWGRAVDEAETLRAQETDLAAKAARLSGELARRAEVQRNLRELDQPDAVRRREESLRAAEAAHLETDAHVAKLADAQRALKLATVSEEHARAGIERLEALSERLMRAEGDLAAARDLAARQEARASELGAADVAGATASKAAQDSTDAIRKRLAAAQKARLAQAAQGRAEQLARTLVRAEELRATFEQDQARRTLLVVTPRALSAAEQARDDRDRVAAQLAAQSVSVSFAYTGPARVKAAGTDLSEGPHRLSSEQTFDLPGIGTMSIDPGSATGGDEAGLAAAEGALRTKLAACGAETLAEARRKLTEAQGLDEALRGAQALLAELAPDGLEALRHAHALAQEEAAAGADLPTQEDPAELEAELASAAENEASYRTIALEAHAAFSSAAEARAGARAGLASAERAADAVRAEAGDHAELAARLNDLRAEHLTHLARRAEAEAVCRRLEQLTQDLDMIAAQLARAKSVVAQAQTSRERFREELATLNGSIGTMAEQGLEEALDEVRGRLASAEARAARYAAEVQALSRLRATLEDARRQARDAYFGPVVRELEPLLSVLHPGAVLQIDDQTLLPVALVRGGQSEALDILSGGTREQVAVLTRLAFARLFARTGTAVPVILDDALVHSDDDRIEAMFTALHHVAKDQQILVLTCRQRAFAALGGAKAQVIIRAI